MNSDINVLFFIFIVNTIHLWSDAHHADDKTLSKSHTCINCSTPVSQTVTIKGLSKFDHTGISNGWDRLEFYVNAT